MPRTNLKFTDLNSLSSLKKLDESFLRYLSIHSPEIEEQIIYYRELGSSKLGAEAYSKFITQIGSITDDFIADLFQIDTENLAQKKDYEKFDPIYEARRKFIQRYVTKEYTKDSVSKLNFEEITNKLKAIIGEITQEKLANAIINWQLDSSQYQQRLELAAQYCAFMYYNNSTLSLFDVPRPVDENNHIREHKIKQLAGEPYIGFDYRDHMLSDEQAAAHTKYCIYCHKQGKDSCSKGFHHINPKKYPEKEKDGCPLKQKISEMNFLKDHGLNIGALAAIVVDNPMVASTGHRICNDCMKACIFQKQEPVNVPIIETNILENVLKLPWGVEIYLLLTKWNPINIDSPLPKDNTGYNVLVTGLGPAGFALSHYLLNEGHNITAIDGLKITPLHFDASKPIKHWDDIRVPLSEKTPQGFGGVAEYGITNRWDKNNLTLIRLILERRKSFKMHGGIRLGSNITTKQAFDSGFDHIALCLGAGKPNYINKTDYFAKGVKSAADFLMNLQQGGAHLKNSNSNMQIRLPAIVIGCGLTAIDSAVELLHYYPTQVENFLQKWKTIDTNNITLSDEERSIADEYTKHARLFRTAKNDVDKLKILQQLGGVTICYRKNIKDSPAYRLNHEEIEHAMSIGVKFIENVEPQKIELDQYGAASILNLSNNTKLPAKTILVAIGTNNSEFVDIDGLDETKSTIFKNKSNNISYFGDCNQKYAGSVVKALASAKNGYKQISNSLFSNKPKSINGIKLDLQSTIQKVNIISDDITEIIVKSETCSNNFKPGQFFRLQNFSNDLKSTSEPLALTGYSIDREKNLLSFIIQNIGTSSTLCSSLKEGDSIILMGPTGEPTKIVSNQNVLLIGGGIGNALLIPIASALKENGCKVTFISGYRKHSDLIFADKIEGVADNIVRSFEEDKDNPGTIINALKGAKEHEILEDIDHIYCNGSDIMMNVILKHKESLFPNTEITYSINSPMQCMMKGICGQCIQKTNDVNGYIFSCACQDIEANNIDFKSLHNRLSQNSLFEKVSGEF
jgi:NADPH-dependent glutamate synthase beta subunit-like oxidoreductase/ferredoxin-NADP reductase